MRDIKPIHIQKLYNNMAAKELKHNTIKKVANILHSSMSQAVKSDLIVKNLCDADTMPKAGKKERRVLSAEEQKLFLEFIHDSKEWERYYPLFVIAFGTGMRIGELLALQWEDIDFKKRNIKVYKNLQYMQDEKTRECQFVVQAPKTKQSNRTIPMLDKVADAFRNQRKDQSKAIIMLGDRWEQADDLQLQNLIFTTEVGKPLSRTSVNRTITSIVNAINKQGRKDAEKEKREYEPMADFTPHSIRHSFATRCFENGVPAKVVQDFMGHTNLFTTMDIYTHVTEDGKHEEIEKISNVV